MHQLAPLSKGANQKIATRAAYGQALLELGNQHQDVVVLDADLSGSTKTAVFGKAHPDRFFNCGVAESNMMGTAAGLACTGRKVFASSFAMFATGKAWEPVRQSICIPQMDVKICASHAGLTVGEDGKSHQMLEDITLMRVLPHMKVIVPADSVETAEAVRLAYETPGPVYVRLSRASTPVIFGDEYRLELGRGAILRDGSDLCIAACGVELAEAMIAADILANRNIEARVVNLACIDPIDVDLIVDSAEHCGAILTAEEHQIRGGFMVSISMFWLNFFARFLNRDPPIAKFLARGAYATYVIHPPFVVVLLWSVWLVCGIGNPWKHASGYWYNAGGYPDGKGTQWSSATQQVLAFIFVSVAGSIAIWLAAGRVVKMERLKDII